MPLCVDEMVEEEAGIDLKQLSALVTVVEAGSVTRAAHLLQLAQPAVTRHIRTLERDLGIELFERTRYGMRPTTAGANFAERARRVLAELNRARAELAPLTGQVAGIVSVGLLESTAELLAEPLASAILDKYPDVELRLLTAYSGHLQQWLDDGDLDLSLLYNLTSTPSLNVSPLVREQLWILAAASEGLDPRQPMPLAQIAARPAVMPAPGHGLHALIMSAARRTDVDIDVAVQTNSMALQKQLVRSGLGWTILPAVAIGDAAADGPFSAAPVVEPEIWRSLVLGTPRTGRATPAAEAVAVELVGQIRTAVTSGRWPSAKLQLRT